MQVSLFSSVLINRFHCTSLNVHLPSTLTVVIAGVLMHRCLHVKGNTFMWKEVTDKDERAKNKLWHIPWSRKVKISHTSRKVI